ncbi:hypothetical protein LEMLEM_LOCUS2694, partial [Lemmus lemmus]
ETLQTWWHWAASGGGGHGAISGFHLINAGITGLRCHNGPAGVKIST